jgi:hypothetical protein
MNVIGKYLRARNKLAIAYFKILSLLLLEEGKL